MSSVFKILVSFIWCSATLLKRMFYEAHFFSAARFPIYTVSIGNIESGGTGKTPFLFELLREIPERYHSSVLVLSRGYRSLDEKGFGVYPSDSIASWEKMGDENYVLKTTFPRVWLAVGANRVQSAKAAFSQASMIQNRFRLVVLDDGFQHLAVSRDFDFILRTARKWGETYFRDFGFVRKLLPVSRQKWIFSKGRDFQISIDGEKLLTDLKSRVGNPHSEGIRGEVPLSAHLMIGLGFPQMLQDQLSVLSMKQGWNLSKTTRLSDHGFLTETQWRTQLAEAEERDGVILVTEKDSVKIPILESRWMNRIVVVPYGVDWFTPRRAVFERILALFEGREVS